MTRDAAKLLDHIAELERKLKAEQAARINYMTGGVLLYGRFQSRKAR